MSERIAIVEDDPTIRELVAERLRDEGYDVDAFAEAEQALDSKAEPWGVAIVDVMLGGRLSGLELCERFRQAAPALPILILSALAEPADRIEGLRRGADDYLAKPFEMEELLLRVRGMLRRSTWYARLPQEGSVFRWDGHWVDFVKRQGAAAGGPSFEMGTKECMLLKLLVERVGEVVTRDEILDRVWGYDAFPSSRTVDNFVLRLRKYFETTPGDPRYIHSVRGMGYRFTR